MTVRGIHLELASDLSTDAFIMALHQFHSRRGHGKIIRSDNGTNFFGAVTELKEVIKRIDHSKVVKYCSERQINFQWIFKPPSSPWMGEEGGGGAWESLIKTVKRSINDL